VVQFFDIIRLHVRACVPMGPVIEPMPSFDETSLQPIPLESTPKPPVLFLFLVISNDKPVRKVHPLPYLLQDHKI